MFLTSHKFNPVQKDRLFYDRFEYCLGFCLDEVSCLRQLDHDHINQLIERKQQWRRRAQDLQYHSDNTYPQRFRWREITQQTVTDLHVLADHLLTTPAEFKLVVTTGQGYVYTNDLELIDQLSNMPGMSNKTYTQAQIVRPKNTIKLKNSPYAFRSYFKMLKLTVNQKEILENFLIAQSQHVRLSPSLIQWISQPFVRTQDYFFVDHDSEKWPTMLSLIQPGIVRKTMHIIADK